MSPALHIRAALPADRAAVRAVHEAAFETPGEADLVERLCRSPDPIVSLVAQDEGALVGHILFSPVTLGARADLRLMGLAPMAVLPARQRQGIGSALVRAGLQRCRASGCDAVVVLGHPGFYPRFGFVPAAGFGIGCEYEVPDDAFMLLELAPGSLRDAHGTVRYHAAFDAL